MDSYVMDSSQNQGEKFISSADSAQQTKTTVIAQVHPIPLQNATKVGFDFGLLNSLLVGCIVFFAQFVTEVISDAMVNFSPQGKDSLIRNFGRISLWEEPTFGQLTFFGYLYLFVAIFFITKYPRIGKYFVIFPIMGLIMGVYGLLMMFAFGGFTVLVLIFDNLIPPSVLLLYRRKVTLFNFRSFLKYYLLILFFILLVNIIASIAQLSKVTNAVNNATPDMMIKNANY